MPSCWVHNFGDIAELPFAEERMLDSLAVARAGSERRPEVAHACSIF